MALLIVPMYGFHSYSLGLWIGVKHIGHKEAAGSAV